MSNCYYSKPILSSILLCILASTFTTTTVVVNGQATSCDADDPDNTIFREVCADPDLSTLCGLLSATELDSDLSNNESLTLFAPINSAFTNAPRQLIGFNNKQLKKTLKYHVTGGDIETNSLSCTIPTSSKLGSLTSQTQCNADNTIREGQVGNVIVLGTPLFVSDGDSNTPCNGRIIKVTNILGTGLKFFPPNKKSNNKGSKGGRNNNLRGGKSGKSDKGGGARGGGSGAWRNYNNNDSINNSEQQADLLYSYFGVRPNNYNNNNNNYNYNNNNNNYSSKKGPKSFKAGSGGSGFKAGKSFKKHGGGGFYGKSDKKRNRFLLN
jgi:hypothetical protein